MASSSLLPSSSTASWKAWIPSFGDLTAGSLLALLNTFYAVSFSALLFGHDLNDYTPTMTTVLLLSAAVSGVATSVFSTFVLSSAGPDPILVSVLFTSSTVVAAFVTDPREAFVTMMALIMLSSFTAAAICLIMASLRLGHFVYAVPGPVTAGFLAGCGFILLDESVAIMGAGSFRRAAKGALAHVGLLAPVIDASSETEPGTQAALVLLVGLVLGVGLVAASVMAPRQFSVIMPLALIGCAVTLHAALAASGRAVPLFGGPSRPGQQPWAVGAGWILATPDRAETEDVPGSDVADSLRGAWAWAVGDIGRLSMPTLLREAPQALLVVPLVTAVTVLLRAVGLDVWEGQQKAVLAGEPITASASDPEPAAATETPERTATDAAAGADAGPDAGGAAGEKDSLLTHGDAGEAAKDGAHKLHMLTRFDAELRAAGISCFLSGLVGGPPAFVEYAATVLNAGAGATGRPSGVVSGLLCLALALSGLAPVMLRAVPVPVLGGLIAYLGLHLVWEWGWRYVLAAGGGATGDSLVVLVTLVGTVVVGFLPGLIAGAGLTLLQHCLCSAERAAIRSARALDKSLPGAEVVVLVGQLDFGAAAALVWRVQERLDRVRRPVGSGSAELCLPGRWNSDGAESTAGADTGHGSDEEAEDESQPEAKKAPGGGAAATPVSSSKQATSRTGFQWPWPSGDPPAASDADAADTGLAGTGEEEEEGAGAGMAQLEWLVLDMSGVTGMDRSAAAAVLKLCDVLSSDGGSHGGVGGAQALALGAGQGQGQDAGASSVGSQSGGAGDASGLRRRTAAGEAAAETLLKAAPTAPAAAGEDSKHGAGAVEADSEPSLAQAAAGASDAVAGGTAARAGDAQSPEDEPGKPVMAGRSRVIVAGLGQGLCRFIESSSGHAGEGAGGDSSPVGEQQLLAIARARGALPLFVRSIREAKGIVASARSDGLA